MTPTPDSAAPQGGVAVTQADREIAAAILEGPPWRHDRIAAMVRAGKADDYQLVRCAAQSRLASAPPAQQAGVEDVAQLIGDRIEEQFQVFVTGSWATKLAEEIATLNRPSPAPSEDSASSTPTPAIPATSTSSSGEAERSAETDALANAWWYKRYPDLGGHWTRDEAMREGFAAGMALTASSTSGLTGGGEAQHPSVLLAHLRRMPMTEWAWSDAEMIFATLQAIAQPDAVTSEMSARSTDVPVGYVMVPVEPTKEMLRAVDGEDDDKFVARGRAYSAWCAMIAAASAGRTPE